MTDPYSNEPHNPSTQVPYTPYRIYAGVEI